MKLIEVPSNLELLHLLIWNLNENTLSADHALSTQKTMSFFFFPGFKTEHLSFWFFLWILKFFANRSHLLLLYWHLTM